MNNINLTYSDSETGEDISITVPARWEICPDCEGNGSIDNPAFSNGLSQEDFDEDPDFRHDYLAGRYDVGCDKCHSEGKVQVPDVSRCSMALKRKLVGWRRCERDNARYERESRAEMAMERRMGC